MSTDPIVIALGVLFLLSLGWFARGVWDEFCSGLAGVERGNDIDREAAEAADEVTQ